MLLIKSKKIIAFGLILSLVIFTALGGGLQNISITRKAARFQCEYIGKTLSLIGQNLILPYLSAFIDVGEISAVNLLEGNGKDSAERAGNFNSELALVIGMVMVIIIELGILLKKPGKIAYLKIKKNNIRKSYTFIYNIFFTFLDKVRDIRTKKFYIKKAFGLNIKIIGYKSSNRTFKEIFGYDFLLLRSS